MEEIGSLKSELADLKDLLKELTGSDQPNGGDKGSGVVNINKNIKEFQLNMEVKMGELQDCIEKEQKSSQLSYESIDLPN